MGLRPAQVVDRAMQWSPYAYDANVVKRSDPNKKRRWLIPLVLAAQIAFKVGPPSPSASAPELGNPAYCL